MISLLILLAAGLWSFYITLLLDRPDLATIVPPDLEPIVHASFAIILLATTLAWSWIEIKTSKSWLKHGLGIYLRNLIVISLGVALIIFTCREVVHGLDPTGHQPLW